MTINTKHEYLRNLFALFIRVECTKKIEMQEIHGARHSKLIFQTLLLLLNRECQSGFFFTFYGFSWFIWCSIGMQERNAKSYTCNLHAPTIHIPFVSTSLYCCLIMHILWFSYLKKISVYAGKTKTFYIASCVTMKPCGYTKR